MSNSLETAINHELFLSSGLQIVLENNAPIAHGYFGQVFEANLIDALGQSFGTYMIKKTGNNIEPSIGYKSFLQEYNFLQIMEERTHVLEMHPHTPSPITLITQGTDSFLIMQKAPGESIARMQLSTQEAIMIAIQLLEAASIMEAECGSDTRPIIHREIEPEHIFYDTDKKSSTYRKVTLIDFGLAERQQMEPLLDNAIILGKVEWLSPEGCMGEYDPTLNTFQIGMVLCTILTKDDFMKSRKEGKIPFDIAGETITGAYIKQAEHALRTHGIDNWLQHLILKAIALHPHNRFTNPKEMQIALSTWNKRNI